MSGEADWLDGLLRWALTADEQLPVSQDELDTSFDAAMALAVAADSDPVLRAELDGLVQPILRQLLQ